MSKASKGGRKASKGAGVVVNVRAARGASVTVNVDTGRKAKKADKGKAPLTFGDGNAKLKGIHTFSIPAGWTCPGADECLAKANRDTGKITDGTDTVFRCFSASQEAAYPSVRDARWRNLTALKAVGNDREALAALILASIPSKAQTIRVHVAGDFYSQAYFDAWCLVAERRPDLLVYAYTKSLRFWAARLDTVGTGRAPGALANFVLTASVGGKDDALIEAHGLRYARVVYSQSEADALGLEIDHDDTHAMTHGADFALIIHGMQPPGSAASKALSALRAAGDYGYGDKADARRKALDVVR